MLKFLFPIISLICIISLLYGGIFTILNRESNQCRMTYMFEHPQFIRINYEANKFFPKYALYAYSEGSIIERTRAMAFTGAPVIFIPGNSGSFKQGRSLASVALRKGLDNDWTQHLDYFTVDLHGEYTALFGGYLYEQQQFIKACIRTVLNLYKKQQNPPKQVILIGHSMGGKLAQSILIDPLFQPLINTVISLAGPMERPVLNIDSYFNQFYSDLNQYFLSNRTYSMEYDNTVNYCNSIATREYNKSERLLDDKLLITIGGGARDLYVHSGLTYSNFSDISVITTSIPFVWLSTDHLCAAWCLELVLVINRFLHSIITPIKGRYNPKYGLNFLENKADRLRKAESFFFQPAYNPRYAEVNLSRHNEYVEWYEDSRRVYTAILQPNWNKTSIHMIRLVDAPQYKYLSVTVINLHVNDWVFGCAALEVKETYRLCSKGMSLSHLVSKSPAFKERKTLLNLDLHKLKQNNPHWTHVLLKFPPSREKIILHVDTHDPASRNLRVTAPIWYSFQQHKLLDDTLIGSSFYKLEMSGLDESYQSIQFNIKPRGLCATEKHHAMAKICVPWLKFCNRFQHFTDIENLPLYLNVPVTKPIGYNTTENPISVFLHLDPNCRYQVTYVNSFGSTMSRIFQQFIHWIPAHITAIILLALRHQISITPSKEEFKCGKLHVALFTTPSFFLITTTKILSKMLINSKSLASNDMSHSMLISVVIHGTAFSLIITCVAIAWIAIYLYGNMIHKILSKIIKLPIPSLVDLPGMSIIEKIPLTAGILLISIALGSCGGVALLLGCVIYFLLIVKTYEDYLEEFVFHTAKMIAMKLFGKVFSEKKDENLNKTNENISETADVDKSDKSDHNDKKVKNKISKATEKDAVPKKVNEKKIDKKDQKKRSKKDKTVEIGNQKGNEIKDKTPSKPSGSKELSDILDESVKQEISDKSEILLKTFDNSLDDTDFPNDITDEELDKMLAEAIEKQAKLMKEKKQKEALERLEYDSVHESFSSINFNLTLFLLLCVLAILNLPATISWAKNYSFNKRLNADPSLVPAIISLSCLSVLWQISAPRNVCGYMVLAMILYVCGALSVLYCQDSIYLLNYLIPLVYVIITLMQIFLPIKCAITENDLHEMDLHNKVERIRGLLREEAAMGFEANNDSKEIEDQQNEVIKLIDNDNSNSVESLETSL